MWLPKKGLKMRLQILKSHTLYIQSLKPRRESRNPHQKIENRVERTKNNIQKPKTKWKVNSFKQIRQICQKGDLQLPRGEDEEGGKENATQKGGKPHFFLPFAEVKRVKLRERIMGNTMEKEKENETRNTK